MEKVLKDTLVLRKIIDRLQRLSFAVGIPTILLASSKLILTIPWTLFSILIALAFGACLLLLVTVYIENCYNKEVNPDELIYECIEEITKLKAAKAKKHVDLRV